MTNSIRAPVFIPAFNTVTYVRQMVRQLLGRGCDDITILDNGSSFPPMLDYLDSNPDRVRVVMLGHNFGPRHIFVDPTLYGSLPDIFCVTDPDLEFNPVMPPNFIDELSACSDQLELGKIGLALQIEGPDLREEEFTIGGLQFTIPEWERQFWRSQIGNTVTGDPVFDAPTDTTFALYNKRFFRPESYLNAARVGGRYTCRHLPWHKERLLPPEEEEFYRRTSKHSYYLQG